MEGTIAITDHGWYEFLLQQEALDEVNFWTPSAHWTFHAGSGSPFFFKLKARYGDSVCGFAFFDRFVRLPDWLAWDVFGVKNGCPSLDAMRDRIGDIRERIDYHAPGPLDQIGCILLVQPTFFAPGEWIRGPRDWPSANLRPKKYELTSGEGLRIWQDCSDRVANRRSISGAQQPGILTSGATRYGTPMLIQPRLGQGTFRVAVLEAYSRACAVTSEHSLPALEASHIQPFSNDGPHEVRNGILLRADLHRLFDQGYLTITTKLRLEVSPRLKLDYDNGHTYYPLHGSSVRVPRSSHEAPSAEFIRWHNEKVYRES